MILFFLLSIILLITAVGVIASHNPITSALCLITNMFCIAAMFAMLNADFLATVQIIVYAGAVMVLVLFVLMLLNIKVETPKGKSFFFIALCVAAGVAFVGLGAPLLNETFKVFPDPSPKFVGTMNEVGKELYTKYIFPFEAASILIMAAVAGAVMLAKRKLR